MPNKEGEQIGVVSHYFGNIEVAIIKLSKKLEKGEKIRFVGGLTDFEQKINSMEVDYKKVEKASPRNEVGVKVKEKVREGYKVYRA